MSAPLDNLKDQIGDNLSWRKKKSICLAFKSWQ